MIYAELLLLSQKLKPSEDAAYEKAHQQGKRTPCLPGTRTEIFSKVDIWMDDPTDHRVFWLNGMAGTGKSTIADTLTQRAKSKGLLGGAYFCSRDLQNTRNPSNILPTLASQMAFNHEGYRVELMAVLKDRPSPSQGTLEQQLENLILSPLKKMPVPLDHPFLVVVDALDECDHDRVRPLPFIQFLLRHVDDFRQTNLKFFISSRPAHEISSAFKGDVMGAHDYLNLHDELLPNISRDVRSFVIDRLDRIARDWTHPPPFTFSDADVDAIVKKAGPLFIFAATVCRFIADASSYHSPQRLLGQVTISGAGGDANEQEELDDLYKRVFDDAFSRRQDRRDLTTRRNLRDVVGSILLLSQPLGLVDLALLLGEPHGPDRLRLLLSHMHSVIAIPEDDSTPIRAFHASFEDHVTNKNRAHPDFYVDPAGHHAKFAMCCFRVMRQDLKDDNFCGLTPNVDYDDVSDLKERRKEHIPGALEYACRHWIDHVVLALTPSSAPRADNVIEGVKFFAFHLLLRWIDVMSLLGCLDSVVQLLVRLQQVVKVRLTVIVARFQPTHHPILGLRYRPR